MKPDPITLIAELTKRHYTAYSDGTPVTNRREIPAAVGTISIDPFGGCEITEVKPDCISLDFAGEIKELRPGASVCLSRTIEGREWSDGCTYDGTDYTLTLTWPLYAVGDIAASVD